MRTYETIFVLKPDMGADAQAEQVEFYKDSITKNGGEIINVELWGKLSLAYRIENFSEGIYVLIQFKAETEYLPELEKRYKFNESVLRHVIVMVDEKKFKLKPRKDPVKRERKSYRKTDDASEVSDPEFAEAQDGEDAKPAEDMQES